MTCKVVPLLIYNDGANSMKQTDTYNSYSLQIQLQAYSANLTGKKLISKHSFILKVLVCRCHHRIGNKFGGGYYMQRRTDFILTALTWRVFRRR